MSNPQSLDIPLGRWKLHLCKWTPTAYRDDKPIAWVCLHGVVLQLSKGILQPQCSTIQSPPKESSLS